MTNKAPSCAFKACVTRRRGRPSRDAEAMPREEILHHAFAAFARDGFDGVSLRALAAACGVSDSLITHHFGTKQQLWREATDSVFTPLYARLLALLDALAQAQAGDAVRVLQNNLPAALKLVANDPLALQFLFREGEGDDERGDYIRAQYVQPYLARLDLLFTQAQARGAYRAVSPGSRHALVLGLLRTLVIPGVLRAELAPHLADEASRSAYIDEAVTIIYSGLALEPYTPHNPSSPGDAT